MKKFVAIKWVKALRSGKYKQGRRRLKSLDNSYCCLGVLCEIMGIEPELNEDLDSSGSGVSYNFNGHSLNVPTTVLSKSGLKDSYGNIDLPGGRVSLVGLNDVRKRSFKHIAAFIERNYKKL